MLETQGKYLITGGSGFLGRALIERLMGMGIHDIRVVSRNEGKLTELMEKFPSVEVIPGDISDSFICDKVMDGVSGVFHLAAFKYVGLAEANPRQCVQSNVIGSMNVLDSSLIYKPEFVIGISTDKAARVSGVYGATKLLQERLFHEYEEMNPNTKYRTVRYGNVLYSTGSVLCKWKEKLSKGEEIVITDIDATRFYWTVDQAIDLIFDCLNNATDATPHHAPMKAIRMGDLLQAMCQKYLPVGEVPKVRTIGLQKGENMHEIISEDGKDSSTAERYELGEIYELI